jgi:hypothetical protein
MSRSFSGFVALALFAGCVFSPEAADAQTTLPPNWLSTQVNEGGQHCLAVAERRQGDKLFLACGAAGAWEISLTPAGPKFVRSHAFSGDVVGFVPEADGRLWVILHVLEARPLTAAGAAGEAVFPDVVPAAPPAALPPVTGNPTAPAAAPVAARERYGRVKHAADGEVVITLGAQDGIKRGDHIEFAQQGADADESEEPSLSSDVIAVGVVTNVIAHNARVRLGLNERVPEGALALPTASLSTASLSAPPRISGLWELELALRPFAAIDELGGGALFSGSFGYRSKHMHLQAVLDPLAFAAVETKGSVAAVNAAAIASYDSQYVEMGLGLGFQTVNDTGSFLEAGSGLTAVQQIRLGTRDGLNLTARTNIALFHSQFQFGGMVASGQIPLTRGYWLLLNGGGGSVGYGYGELGLRALLAGNGFAGSKYLTVTAGGVGVFKSGTCDENFSCTDEKAFGGPMVGVGGEWRF